MDSRAEAQRKQVRQAYATIARERAVSTPAACCRDDETASAADYSPEELASVPAGAFLGEGSGNPVRAARLRSGETVVDLGCGAGMDAFLAANQVGASGRVFGFDMTPEMLERARRNQVAGGYRQVELREADIASLPLPGDAADVVISNCVINLAPDKTAVYREIYRTLKPGGRFAIADIVLQGDTERLAGLLDKLPGCNCVKTALEQGAYLEAIRAAGFEDVRIVAERPAASQATIEAFADRLGLREAIRDVTARAITVVGGKPRA